jgi:hypothetical protein
MPNLRVDTIKSQDGTTGPTFDGNLEFSGESHFVLPKGTTAQRPTGVAAGSMRFNTDTKLVEQYNGTEWVTLNSYGVGRGVFGGGGSAPATVNLLDYITITTLGNASYFGDLTLARQALTACSSSTRGVFGSGYTSPGGGNALNLIDYITIATTGNAVDFGDLTQIRRHMGACSSSTRGVFGGGVGPSPTFGVYNTIDYITIATTGNATDFGDLTATRDSSHSCSSSTRGIWAGGYLTPTTNQNIIDYITIATTGNATDFGDLFTGRYGFGACSSSTRGVFAGGTTTLTPTTTTTNIIDYITIATTGNAQNFGGILTQSRNYPGACSNTTRGVFGGGGAPVTNIIDYITIASNGTNAQDFGDLTLARGNAACSDAHGGLQ